MAWTKAKTLMQRTNFRRYGEDVTYIPAAGGSLVVTGIYRSAHEAVDSEGLTVHSNQPVLDVKLEDLPAAPVSGQPGQDTVDQVTVRGNTFDVVDVQEDGEGIARLLLHRA